ncbi:exodeoxyribonuclease-3 [Nitratireductor aquibiodomus]|uniref:Exodeoxyribonuclease-3 n=1 Tax=Nitratireductor aquibiodomus TaxID=204799 RepID=A0A1H4KAH0_9HYPH|nr:exodeoxyribonuclease III [Nitratireductor aquibiodomus]SEB55433.1 exodeoxyribonuclease-3 [Nitratireductor aquibiodomus]
MPFTIATWNINSVRLRMPLVEQFLERYSPDVLCLQETKCADDQFPAAAFRKAGYEHMAIHGQKGYHGVATIARRPLKLVEKREFCGMGDSRHISVSVDAGAGRSVLLHNFYVPAGGDEPDPAINPKFRHKLDFLAEMHALRAEENGNSGTILVGDLNIAPLETDVWSHKQLLKVVSHTPVETEGLERLRREGGWVDLMREKIPPEEKIFTWWSYRAKDWALSDRGRRLDHIWSSPNLSPSLNRIEVLREARGWDRPSDHVPVIAGFDFG